jgi:hypothetical protein
MEANMEAKNPWPRGGFRGRFLAIFASIFLSPYFWSFSGSYGCKYGANMERKTLESIGLKTTTTTLFFSLWHQQQL